MTRASIIGRTTVRELVQAYTKAVADIRTAWELVHGAETQLNKLFSDGALYRSIHIRGGYQYHYKWSDVDDTLSYLRIDVWSTLIERMELKRFLSVKAWEQLQRSVEKGEMPEITEETVTQVYKSFSSQMGNLLAEAVQEVFEWLTPQTRWGRDYKSNNKEVVGERVILSGVIDVKWSLACGRNAKIYSSGPTNQKLTALENVFSALDGQGQISKGYYSDLARAIEATPLPGSGETKYFKFKVFKTGTMHLQFKRGDLLAQLNKIAAGRNLKSGPKAGQ